MHEMKFLLFIMLITLFVVFYFIEYKLYIRLKKHLINPNQNFDFGYYFVGLPLIKKKHFTQEGKKILRLQNIVALIMSILFLFLGYLLSLPD